MVERTSKRVTALAALMVAAGAITAVAIPATAVAQEGSRICGNYWEAVAQVPKPGTTDLEWKVVGLVAKVYEVPKVDFGICHQAKTYSDSINGEPLPAYNGTVTWNPRQEIDSWTCEDFGDLINKPGEDPCHSMNRMDFYTEVTENKAKRFNLVY